MQPGGEDLGKATRRDDLHARARMTGCGVGEAEVGLGEPAGRGKVGSSCDGAFLSRKWPSVTQALTAWSRVEGRDKGRKQGQARSTLIFETSRRSQDFVV